MEWRERPAYNHKCNIMCCTNCHTLEEVLVRKSKKLLPSQTLAKLKKPKFCHEDCGHCYRFKKWIERKEIKERQPKEETGERDDRKLHVVPTPMEAPREIIKTEDKDIELVRIRRAPNSNPQSSVEEVRVLVEGSEIGEWIGPPMAEEFISVSVPNLSKATESKSTLSCR